MVTLIGFNVVAESVLFESLTNSSSSVVSSVALLFDTIVVKSVSFSFSVEFVTADSVVVPFTLASLAVVTLTDLLVSSEMTCLIAIREQNN